MKAQVTWKKRNGEGFGSVCARMQKSDAPKLELLIGMIIEYLSSIDMDKAVSEKMCSGWVVQFKE